MGVLPPDVPILIGLRYEALLWSSRKIGEYLGIKRGIHKYFDKISQNYELQKIFRNLLNVHQGRVFPQFILSLIAGVLGKLYKEHLLLNHSLSTHDVLS